MDTITQLPLFDNLEPKRCPKCGETFPRTEEFWYRDKRYPNGYSGWCKKCHNKESCKRAKENPEKANEKSRRWRENNPEKTKIIISNYHEKNRERERESNRKRYHEKKEQYDQSAKERHLMNPEKKRAIQKRYYDKNRSKQSERKILYRQQNNEQMRERERQRYKENPIPTLRRHHKRKALQKGSNGSYTQAELQAQFESQQKRCFHCGKWLVLGNGKFCHVDHWIPLIKGGSNNIENIRLLCPFCNLSKNDKLPCEWHEKYCI